MSGEAVVSEAPSSSSTHDIVANVVETAEANAAAAETPTPEPAASEADPADIPGTRYSEEEELLREFGFKRHLTADGRDHVIPRSKVLSMIASGLKRGRDKWATERTPIEKELGELRAFREELIADVKGEDTKRFLERISEYNPAFKSYLQPPAAPAQMPAPAEDQMPGPDLDLGNGQKTYSIEGLQKLLEWNTKRVESKMDERLKPLAEREQAERQRAEQAKAQEALQQRVTSQIDAAKQWPNWTEYEGDVLKLLQEDSAKAQAEQRRPTMTLREAYLEAHSNRLAADDNEKRRRWMEEANRAPVTTAVTRSGVEGTRGGKPRDSKDVVRDVIAKLERQSS